MNYWNGFQEGNWTKKVDVRDFIQKNFSLYTGDSEFLTGPTDATEKLWAQLGELTAIEREKGVLDAETKIPSSITAYGAGYIDQSLEKIVGLQTDKPLKRAIMPNGGVRLVKGALQAYGYDLDPQTWETFTKYRKTHNDGVFDAYTSDIRKARSSGIITGLPDAYGRGRIIGDYRRVALYGVDRLIADKLQDQTDREKDGFSEDEIRTREEISEQIKALKELNQLGETYGCELNRPAANAQEAIQWTYLAYLAATKQQDGAAMSLGRVSTFLDIYISRDLAAGTITEQEAQEFMDHFVMKLRIIRFLRPPAYNELFSGDPTWVTECLGGIGCDGRPLVTKNSFRMLYTLVNLGPAPEPNMTVLWSEQLPENFKLFCADISCKTSAVQYENDDLMRPTFGDDYGIACCVSAMKIGEQMQLFGARANLAKTLLYAINGGRDEKSGDQIAPEFQPITSEYLEYDEVMRRFDQTMDWLSKLYIKALNIIHYMHDKYSYESLELALHKSDVERIMGAGIAGLSVVADSLSAIKYSKVKVIRDETGLAVDFEVEGDYPKYGNNDDKADDIACEIVSTFMTKLRKEKAYRNAEMTQSILTITSNVVYGKKTGATPDGRKAGVAFAPGANPMHGRDSSGVAASISSVAKLPYEDARDGISNTFSIIPKALGKSDDIREKNLSAILDSYCEQKGQHININVLEPDMLKDAMDNPEKYPQLTIRVSGYAVNFIKLTREQQLDVITRTFHDAF